MNTNHRINPHPHADNMRMYAEDAAKTNKPWKNWQYTSYENTQWRECAQHPQWSLSFKYRRKPKMATKWCIMWQHKMSGTISSSSYLYDSAEDATQAAKLAGDGFFLFIGTNSFTYEERS